VDKKVHCIYKHGDFISFDPSNILTAETTLETGNFATSNTTACCNFIVNNKEYPSIIVADQYYRIRCYNKDN